MTILFTHQSCLLHEVAAGHPENPSRLKVLEALFANDTFKELERRDAPLGSVDQIALMHSEKYIEEIVRAVPDNELVYFFSLISQDLLVNMVPNLPDLIQVHLIQIMIWNIKHS